MQCAPGGGVTLHRVMCTKNRANIVHQKQDQYCAPKTGPVCSRNRATLEDGGGEMLVHNNLHHRHQGQRYIREIGNAASCYNLEMGAGIFLSVAKSNLFVSVLFQMR